MPYVIFQFDSDESAEAFYGWWQKDIQQKFLEDTKHDDYTYLIKNIDDAPDVGFDHCNHAVIITESVKSDE
jgi:hypothetical protein